MDVCSPSLSISVKEITWLVCFLFARLGFVLIVIQHFNCYSLVIIWFVEC